MKPEELIQACTVDEITGCWIFKGSIDNGCPKIWMFDPHYGKSRVVSGPRAAAIAGEKRLMKGWRAWMTCKRSECVNPGHVLTGSSKQWGRWVAKNGDLKNNPKIIAASKKQWMKKYPDRQELAKIIVASDEKGTVLAERYGIDARTISKIRNGKCWVAPNPFAGLGK